MKMYMINREEYNKKIGVNARLSFHNDLESIRYLTIPLHYNGKATRAQISAQLWRRSLDESANLSDKKKGLLARLKMKKNQEEIRERISRDALRLMLGLMDLMNLNELIPEYIDEFMKHEDDFYEQFKDIYEEKEIEKYPFSKYIDTDQYSI